jgi:hypothetical protein
VNDKKETDLEGGDRGIISGSVAIFAWKALENDPYTEYAVLRPRFKPIASRYKTEGSPLKATGSINHQDKLRSEGTHSGIANTVSHGG